METKQQHAVCPCFNSFLMVLSCNNGQRVVFCLDSVWNSCSVSPVCCNQSFLKLGWRATRSPGWEQPRLHPSPQHTRLVGGTVGPHCGATGDDGRRAATSRSALRGWIAANGAVWAARALHCCTHVSGGWNRSGKVWAPNKYWHSCVSCAKSV